MKVNGNNYNVSIIRPGGNDTALVKGLVKNGEKKIINDEIMRKFPNVEQVGFYEFDVNNSLAILDMVGGEFCGNATRSLAYLLLKGKKNEIYINVSGTSKPLKAGIKNLNTAFSYMPIYEDINSVQILDNDLYLVKIEGISHLVTAKPKNLTPKKLKTLAKKLLEQNDLLYSQLASGVMFTTENTAGVTLEPIVWVRDIETLFNETACASGTTAIGLMKSVSENSVEKTLLVTQPSGKKISVYVKRCKNRFISALIDGPIEIVKKDI